MLHVGGATARKDEIVRALRGLSERGVAEIGRDWKWRVRVAKPGATHAGDAASAVTGSGKILALPAKVLAGSGVSEDDRLPAGRLESDLRLLGRLLPYYQAALKAGDSGASLESLSKAGDSFILLRPDSPWWPTAGQSKTLRIARKHLSDRLIEILAKNSGRKLLLGYPSQLVTPRDEETSPFLLPIAGFRCSFRLTEAALELDVPVARPAINREWLKNQRRYTGWDPARLRSWLLFEDEQAEVRDEDDIETPELVEVPAFTDRLDAALRTAVKGSLDPTVINGSIPATPPTGIYNVLSLAVDRGSKYTRSAIAEYDRLCGFQESSFAGTALAALFDQGSPALEPTPLLHPFPMSESQLVAARAGLAGPLAVVTGPPGTGKSQVIAALMISAAAAGKSVLFAARQHRALDAVQERLEGVSEERTILIRANDSEGAASFSFSNAIQALLTRPDAPDADLRFHDQYDRICDLDRERWQILDSWRELTRLTGEAAKARRALEQAEADLLRQRALAADKGIALRSYRPPGLMMRIWRALLRLLRLAPAPLIGSAWAVHEGERRLVELKARVAKAEAAVVEQRKSVQGTEERPVALTEKLTEQSKSAVLTLLDSLEAIDQDTRQRLTEISGDSALQGAGGAGFSEEAALLILKHFPLWAVTTLAASSRIPLRPGLFDYVIFDEAAQTDIASAIPLLFRAKAAIIVGDPQQLSMIVNLDPREERDLLRQFDLFRAGIGRFAQGQTSLFGFAASSSSCRRFMLTDHYRCHPSIAGYINEAFYGRRLVALTDVDRLKVPKGYDAGLHWTDVTGSIRARSGSGHSGSASSEAEATAVAEHLARLVSQGFEGTIGIVTFFDFQSKAIHDQIRRRVPGKDLDRHQIKVFTANKFQGDERDVILFSLCLGPDMPSGARFFIQKEKRLLNVAVSRARAICHIFGDLHYAADCGIPHVETLVRRFRAAQSRDNKPLSDRFDSPWEQRLYDALVAKGLSPQPQYPVGGRFLDLALINEQTKPPIQLDIEVDGVAYHRDEDGDRVPTDLWRDHQLRGLGWKILRFWVYELRDDMEKCVERIIAEY